MKLETQRNPNLDVALKRLIACLTSPRRRSAVDVSAGAAMIGSDWPDPVAPKYTTLVP